MRTQGLVTLLQAGGGVLLVLVFIFLVGEILLRAGAIFLLDPREWRQKGQDVEGQSASPQHVVFSLVFHGDEAPPPVAMLVALGQDVDRLASRGITPVARQVTVGLQLRPRLRQSQQHP